MKNKYLYIFCMAIIALVLFSCSDMNDLHQEYLDEGEIVYAAKVDSAKVFPGKNRALLNLYVGAQRIEKIRAYWNNFSDSVDFQINGNVGVFSKMLGNMDEKDYVFDLVSFDKFGNQSLPFEVSGSVLGDNYQNSLIARRAAFLSSVDGILLSFSTAYENNINTIISYTNEIGETESTKVPASDDSFIISDHQPGSEFTVLSTYAPEEGIDTLSSPAYTVAGPFKFNVKELKIVNFSTQHPGTENSVNNIISGSYEVRWHSLAGGSSYPHYATIDMGGDRVFTKLGVWRSVFDVGNAAGDERAPDVIQFLVSNDNETWTDLGIFDFNRFINDEQFYEFSPVHARYLKFVGVSGPENNMVLGGINIYGF